MDGAINLGKPWNINAQLKQQNGNIIWERIIHRDYTTYVNNGYDDILYNMQITHDGGFLMTAGELAVAVREKLNIVFVLFTDNDLALIRIKQEKKSNPIYGTPIRERGTIGGDNIFGVPVIKAFDSVEFDSALDEAFSQDGPIIVEAILNSREYDDLVLRKDKPS